MVDGGLAQAVPWRSRYTPRRSRIASAGWTIGDQVLSALSNLTISLGIGRAGGGRLLGSFTVDFTVYLLALGFQRSLLSEPLMSQALIGDRRADASADASALRCAGVYGVTWALLTAAVGLVLGSKNTLMLAVVLPALLLQDLLRYVALRRRRPRRAAVLDGIWLAVVLCAWPLLTSASGLVVPLLVWGAGAAAACGWGLWTSHGRSTAATALAWWKQEARRFGGLLAFDSVVHALASQGVTLALAGLLGLGDLGALRAAALLLGPAGTALVAFNAFVLPRLASRSQAMTRSQALALSAAAGLMSAVVVGVTVLIGPALSRVLFNHRIDVGYDVLVPLGCGLLCASFSAGLVLHLKALRQVATWTVLRLCAAAGGVPVVVFLASRHGLSGAALGLALQAGLAALSDAVAWFLASRSPRSARPDAGPGPARLPSAP